MSSLSRIYSETRLTAALAIPLIVGQLSQMLMFVTDTVMIGRLGVVPLAASTFANSLLHLPFMFIIGMTMAVSIRVSQARGAQDPAAARAALRHGLYLALGFGLLTLLGAFAVLPFLPVFQQKTEVVQAVPGFFLLVAASMIPAAGSLAAKSHNDAMNQPWPAFWIMLGGVLLNILLNWIFIYGNWGAPALNLEGAGLATLLSRTVSLAGILAWCIHARSLRDWVPHHWFRKPDWAELRHLLKVGFPASLQLLAEVSAFVFGIMMIGTLGPEALAAHQVAISCAATVFMVPLGLSMAMTVRVGEAWGAKDWQRMRPILQGGWLLAVSFALLSGQAFLFLNETIASWFLPEGETLAVAAGLLLVAAAFQIADALQIVSAGALRGLNDVTKPAWISFLAFWVLALPVGWYLTFRLGMGVNGVWWGFTAGLVVTASAFGYRIWRKTHHVLAAKASTPDTLEPAL